MWIRARGHKGETSFSHHRARHDESEFAARLSPGRFISTWGSTLFVALVIGAGATGLTQFASSESKEAQNFAEGDQAGAGMIVRSDVLHIWVPPALIELVERQESSGVIRNHEDLKRFLELRGQEKLWYAMTTRGCQANGDLVDLSLVRRPYDEPTSFPLFQKILAAAAQNPFDDATDEFSSASIHVLTAELAKCEIRDVMAELKRNPYSLVGLERRGDSGDRVRPPKAPGG
jgi:hypothetical protein